MKRSLCLGLLVLALGSCQSVDAPSQPSTSDEMGVLARLESRSALPTAERFRARLAIGGVPAPWRDTVYAKGTVVSLGKVPRGSTLALDVRAYSLSGTDTVWKWFAHTTDTADGDLGWIVLAAEVDTVPRAASVALPVAGQTLAIPAGSWYTTDSTTPWKNLTPSVVGASGTIVPQAGTTLRILLRIPVPGTDESLAGDTLRFGIPSIAASTVGKPSFVPAGGILQPGDRIRIDSAQSGDLVQYRILGATAWNTYSGPLDAATVTLEARSLRAGEASAIATASFTLASAIDSFVAAPKFNPVSGSILASTDSIRFDSIPAGDTVELRIGNATEWVAARALPATTETVHARSRRGAYLSKEVSAVYTIDAGQPEMPRIEVVGSCPSDGCDPGSEVRVSIDSGSLEVALDSLPVPAIWKSFTSGEVVAIDRSLTVFARTTRNGTSSAVARLTVVVAQPSPVQIDSISRTSDSVKVRLVASSGTIRFRLSGDATSKSAASQTIVSVGVGDTLFAWSARGTASSIEKSFFARARKPGRPGIVPTTISGTLAPDEVIRLVPSEVGDSIQYRLGASATWIGYTGTLRAGTDGSITVTARSLRNGLASDDTTKTFAVDTARLAQPVLTPSCDPSCDPGTRVTINAGFGSILAYGALPDTGSWTRSTDSTLSFVVQRDTTLSAFSVSPRKSSQIVTFDVTVQQPDSVKIQETTRYPDSVVVRIVAADGDSIQYARNEDAQFVGTGKTGEATLVVRVLDSVRVRSKRGNATGPVSTYTAVAATPESAVITPAGGHIRDTLSITLKGTPGDALSYRIGTTVLWTPYTAPFRLVAGTVVVHKRASRYGRTLEDSATFVVHAAPGVVTFSGCTVDCGPGTGLTLTAQAGTTIHFASDSTTAYPWPTYTDPIGINSTTTIYAYADSAGYRSKVTGTTVRVVGSQGVQFGTMVTRRPNASSATDSAFVSLVATQDGDSLHHKVGNGPVRSVLYSGSMSIRDTLLSGQTVLAWTSRGTSVSDTLRYTLSPLPAPVEQTPAGSYNPGKSILFGLAPTSSGSQTGDVILLGLAPGSWSKSSSTTLSALGKDTVYARTVRLLGGGYADSSAIRKVVYTIDTVMLTALSTTPGTFRQAFDPSIQTYDDSVDAGVTSLVVNYTARASSEVQSVLFNSSASSTVPLSNAAKQTIAVVATNVHGSTTSYSIVVYKRASDSALAALSTTPGTLATAFSPSILSYVDSVPHDADSVTVVATARTPSNVKSITYNSGSTSTFALNSSGATQILVEITNKNGNKLVYTLQVYRKSFPWGSMTYGGRTYKTTVIGTQTWMAENLNYGGAANDTGVCQGTGTTPGDASACAQYGRLYTWWEAVGGSTTGSSNVPSGLKGICPTGWHLPSNGEWTTLVNYVEADPRVGVGKGSAPLRSKTSWVYLPGTDLFGFTATLAGSRAAGGTFNPPEQPEYWASDKGPSTASTWHFYNETVEKSGFYPEVSLPVRCVKD